MDDNARERYMDFLAVRRERILDRIEDACVRAGRTPDEVTLQMLPTSPSTPVLPSLPSLPSLPFVPSLPLRPSTLRHTLPLQKNTFAESLT